MERGRRQEQHERGRGQQEHGEVDPAIERGQLLEALREGHREQEREQHLGAWDHRPQLVEELFVFAVKPLLGSLAHRVNPRVVAVLGVIQSDMTGTSTERSLVGLTDTRVRPL